MSHSAVALVMLLRFFSVSSVCLIASDGIFSDLVLFFMHLCSMGYQQNMVEQKHALVAAALTATTVAAACHLLSRHYSLQVRFPAAVQIMRLLKSNFPSTLQLSWPC